MVEKAQSGAPIVPRPMRRAKREVADATELRGILERAAVVRIGSHDGEGPFITPLNFGFDWDDADALPTLWLHSADAGRKVDAWQADPFVAIEADVELGVIGGDFACAYSFAFESLMGTARVELVDDPDLKRHGLERIMAHAAPGAPCAFSAAAIDQVAVWRVEVVRLSGKRRAGTPIG